MEPILDYSNKKQAPLVIWSSESGFSSNSSIGDKSRTSNGYNHPRTDSGCTIYSPSSIISESQKFNFNNNRNAVIISNGIGHGPVEGAKFLDSQGQTIKMNSKDSICSSSTPSKEVKKPKVPDGGWGWVIVLSSFLVSMIADGISFSFGLLYVEFLNYFQESNSKTSWIGSLFMSVPLLVGPIMSALVDRYGCKYMTMLGGLISGLGFVVASFGNSVEWEFIFFGVVAGIGLGLVYVTAVVSVAYWFDKYRTLATGLGACGTGAGTFIYAPLTQYFIEEYGWRGTVLLLAGTFFNMCVCGALMRDPEWMIVEQSKRTSLKSIKSTSSCGSISGVDGDSQCLKMEEIKNLLKHGQSPEYILTTLVTTIEKSPDPMKKDNERVPSVRSVVNLPTFVKQNEKVPLEVLQQLSSNKTIFNVILENYPSLLHFKSSSDDGKLHQTATDNKPIPVTMSMRLKKSKKQESSSPTQINICSIEELAGSAQLRKDMEQKLTFSPVSKNMPVKRHVSYKESGQHYLKDIRLHRNSVMYRGAMLNIPRYRLRASSCPDIFRNSMTTLAKENEEKWYADALELVKTMVDFSMFLELHFLLMSVANILLFTCFIVPYFYLAEHVICHGYSEVEASFLLSIIGVANCIGMVGLGWAGDQSWMNVTIAYAASLVLCGISCMVMPLLKFNYNILAAVSAIFGLSFAGNYSFTPSILVQLIPLERFTTAYGLILLCQGIGSLVGPPLAGWIFDITGEWDLTFYLAGVGIIISSFLTILIHLTKNRKIWGSGVLEMDRVSNV